jgi:hypothetical protein
MSELYLRKIRLSNVRCIKEAEINFGKKEPGKGQLVEVIGDNETGKTAVHDGCLVTWDGGSSPNIIRHGAESAEGTILWSDGTLAVRTQTKTKSELTIVGREGVAVKAPASYLKKFGSWFSRDPLAFDDADPKERLKILLEISTVIFERAEIAECMGVIVSKLIPPSNDALDLQQFGRFFASIIERRALISHQRDEKAGFIETLRKTLQTAEDDDEAPVDWAARLADVELKLREIDATEKREQSAINEVVLTKRKLKANAIQSRTDAIQGEFSALLGFARAGREGEITAGLIDNLRVLSRDYVSLTLLNEGEAESVQAAKDRASTAREAIAGTRAEAQIGRDTQLKEQGTRESIASTTKDCAALSTLWDDFQAAAKALERLQKAKVDGSLLPGMAITPEGLITMQAPDGEPILWDDQNTATRLVKAIELCTRGTGEVWNGFIAMDGGERLGPKRKAQVKVAVEEAGIQALLFTVASPEWIAEHGPDIMSVPAGVLKVKK